jgi:hypothetical protein
MDNIEELPYFLELAEYHLSEQQARKTVADLLLKTGSNSPKGGWDKSTITSGPPDHQEHTSFRELVKEARNTGVVGPIQKHLDRSDDIFGGTFSLSTPSKMIGQVTTSYAGHTKILKPPMTDTPVENALSEDIMFYREETCLWSNEHDFEMCTRNYRSYLFSCIALVDAFINRHILIYKFRKMDSKDFVELQSTTRLEDRMNLFLKISTGKDISAINNGTEWQHFKTLRKLRNEMTHINSPSLGYSIGEFADHLNYSRKGVGGMLRQIRELQGKHSLSFIERIRTAPLAYFNDITFKGDGKYIVKRIF